MRLARLVGFTTALLFPLATAIGACVGDDPASATVTPDTDAGPDSDGAAAADAPATPDALAADAADATTKPCCDATKPFGTPRKVVGLRSAGATDFDTAPFLTHDGQAIYFTSDRSGAGDILIATRIGVDSFGDVKASRASRTSSTPPLTSRARRSSRRTACPSTSHAVAPAPPCSSPPARRRRPRSPTRRASWS